MCENGRKWKCRSLLGIGLLTLVGLLVLASFSMSQGWAGNASQTAWYADSNTAASPADRHEATPAVMNGPTEKAVNYGKSLSKTFHAAAEKVMPSVVMITNTPPAASKETPRAESPNDDDNPPLPFGFKGSPFGDLFKENPQLRRFFKELPEMPHHGAVGAGSGVIVDRSGVILTNAHVVAGGGKILVRLQDGREFKASHVKTDPKTDIAVLRIEGSEKFPAAKLGNSKDVEIGDWVLALGQPFGLEGTVTAGIVSATSRGIGIAKREDFIQTDAAINPGNSGGPLVNLDGEVIGINTAISSNNGGYQGVGFAVPINLAKWVGGQLEQKGRVERAYLGVGIQPVTQSLANHLNVKVHEGVLISEVLPDTPAAKAGLKPGDIVLNFAGKTVSNPQVLQGLVEQAPIGSKQSLEILREGKRMNLEVTCKEMPSDLGLAKEGSALPEEKETSVFDKLGIEVENLTAKLAQVRQLSSQVLAP
jgi:serine protease Do